MQQYGLCQHHMATARRHLKLGTLSYDALMGHLKSVYESRKKVIEHVSNNV